jgi:tripartite-type tricarboxylate transporter receptor subunit TctC
MAGKFLLGRRQSMAGAALLAALPGRSFAADYPSQPINFLIPYGPGGTFDSYAREFSKLIQAKLTPSTNVEPVNQPGAAGKEAIFTILNSPPDGYNISMIAIPGLIQSTFNKKNNFDIDKLTWLATLGRDPYGIAVGKNSPIKNVADLKKISAERPISFGSTGPGSTDYVATHIFANIVGLRLKEVGGYNGAVDTSVGVARGDIDCVVHSLSGLVQMAAANLVRVIFTFQEKSSIPGVDDASTIGNADLGKIYQWFPAVAPPNLPQPISSKLSDALFTAAKSPEAKAWAKSIKTSLHPLDQAGTLQMLQEQTALVTKWKHVL